MSPGGPVVQSIKLIRNQDVDLRFRMVSPTSISGWTLSWALYDALGGSSTLSKTPTANDAGQGICTVGIADTDTAGVTPSKDLNDNKGYTWELVRTDAGERIILARGELILLE